MNIPTRIHTSQHAHGQNWAAPDPPKDPRQHGVVVVPPPPTWNSGTTENFTGAEEKTLARLTFDSPRSMTAYVSWDTYKNQFGSAFGDPGQWINDMVDSSGMQIACFGTIKWGAQKSAFQLTFDIPCGQGISFPVVAEYLEVTAYLGRPTQMAIPPNAFVSAVSDEILSDPTFATHTTANYVQPAIGAIVTVGVLSTAGIVPGNFAWVGKGPGVNFGGAYIINAIGAGTVDLLNLGLIPNDPPGSVIAAPATMVSIRLGASANPAFPEHAFNQPSRLYLPPDVNLPNVSNEFPRGVINITGVSGDGSSGLRNGFGPTRRFTDQNLAPAGVVQVPIAQGASKVRVLTNDVAHVTWFFVLANSGVSNSLGPFPCNTLEGFPIPIGAWRIAVTNSDGVNTRMFEVVYELEF